MLAAAEQTNQSGLAAPQNPVDPKELSPTTANPSDATPDDVYRKSGVTREDADQLVKDTRSYREGWSADRLLRMANWTKNIKFDRGEQVLIWDEDKKSWLDVVAYARSQGGEFADDADYVEQFVNNITQMMKMAFVGTLSRSVPPTVIRPQNAEVLEDVTTARAAQQAISIVERMNKMPSLVRMQAAYLYLFGVYFKQTRFLLDGDWAGYDESDVYGEVQIQKPHRMQCPNCGTETPLSSFGNDPETIEPAPRNCPQCQTPLRPEHFWPAEEQSGIAVVGTRKDPKGMVKWTIHSPLEIDVDPTAKDLRGTPILVKETEIDIAEARAMYPNFSGVLKEGQQSQTSPNASNEWLRRAESRLVASPQEMKKITLSEVWITPAAYWKNGDKGFAMRMTKLFPEGCKLTQLGDTVVDIRGKSLMKEWSAGRLNEEHGLLPPSIADVVVPFNERFNDTMDRIDDYYARVANGLTVVNGAALDERRMAGKRLDAGVLTPIFLKGEASQRNISEVIHQFTMGIDKSILEYPSMLLNFAQMLSGCVPQVFGDTVEGVDTYHGQQQALGQAQIRFAVYFDNMKDEQAHAAQNAIECYQQNMTEDMFEVEQEDGSEFRNGYVRWSEMQGRVHVWPDADAGLPQSPEEIRQVCQQLMEAVGAGNPVAQAWFDVLPNQELSMSVLAPSGSVIPGAAQRAVTQQDIHFIVQNAQAIVSGQAQLPAVEKYDTTYPIARDTVQLYKQENCDLKQKNPAAWMLLGQYQQQIIAQDVQEQIEEGQRKLQITQASMPQPPQPPTPPPPDPTVEAAKQDLLQKAKESVDRLDEIAHMGPLGQNGSMASQTSAASEIVNTALKVATAQ